jgi:hypothetical protein
MGGDIRPPAGIVNLLTVELIKDVPCARRRCVVLRTRGLNLGPQGLGKPATRILTWRWRPSFMRNC